MKVNDQMIRRCLEWLHSPDRPSLLISETEARDMLEHVLGPDKSKPRQHRWRFVARSAPYRCAQCGLRKDQNGQRYWWDTNPQVILRKAGVCTNQPRATHATTQTEIRP